MYLLIFTRLWDASSDGDKDALLHSNFSCPGNRSANNFHILLQKVRIRQTWDLDDTNDRNRLIIFFSIYHWQTSPGLTAAFTFAIHYLKWSSFFWSFHHNDINSMYSGNMLILKFVNSFYFTLLVIKLQINGNNLHFVFVLWRIITDFQLLLCFRYTRNMWKLAISGNWNRIPGKQKYLF